MNKDTIKEVRKKVEKMYAKEKYWEAPDSILEEMLDLMVKVFEHGRKEGVENCIKQPNPESCCYKSSGYCEHCAVEEFQSSLIKLL